MKDSMVFYRSFFEAINDLPDENQLIIYKAIFEFGFNETEPNLIGTDKLVFTLIKPQLEANNRKAKIGKENGHKGAEYGHLGGRPPKADNPQETPKEPAPNPQETPKEPSNVNNNVNNNANNNVNDNANVNDKKGVPEFDLFLSYALENKPNVSKQALELKYKAWVVNGWKDGNDKAIKNWKSKLLSTLPYIEEGKPIRKEGEPLNPQSYYI